MGARVTAFISTGLVAILLLFVGRAEAAGVTWRVTNDGADSGACGAAAKPCRSISQAIENATDGDIIEVGAGLYGDISGTGFTQPGDERPGLAADHVSCMICVTKGIRVLSLHGADVTFIRAPAGAVDDEILINHDNVMLGTKDHGFTVSGGNRNGIEINLAAGDCDCQAISIVGGIRVAGNIDIGDSIGFGYRGTETSDRPCESGCTITGQISWTDNEAINNTTGFFFRQGQVDREPWLIQNNVARGGGDGFRAIGGSGNEDLTEVGPLSSTSVINNIATGGSGFGFRLNGPGPTTGNVATANAQGGFLTVPGNAAFSGNSAIGNGGPGIIVDFSLDGSSPAPEQGIQVPTFHAFNHNSIYGNDRNRPVLQLAPESDGAQRYNPGPGAHCGVLNVGELSGPSDLSGNPHPGGPVQLTANDNFWGSTRGPSSTGPGDAVGGACDENNGTTIAKTFAPVSF